MQSLAKKEVVDEHWTSSVLSFNRSHNLSLSLKRWVASRRAGKQSERAVKALSIKASTSASKVQI